MRENSVYIVQSVPLVTKFLPIYITRPNFVAPDEVAENSRAGSLTVYKTYLFYW